MKDIYSDVFGGPGGLGSRSAPNLGAFQQEVMRLMRENPNLDVVTASNRAADAWQSETVTVEADTKLLSPKTWDGEVEEEEFDFRYDTAPTPPDTPEPPEDDSSTGAPAPKPPESPEDPATPKPPKESTNPVSEMKKDPDGNPIVETKEQYDALPVGTTFIAPDGSKRTKK
jgi:outer membrane biosynthesis protein TonB